MVQALLGGVEDGVADGWGDRHYWRFAGSGGSDVFAIDKDSFDLGDVAEARDAIPGEARIRDAAMIELDGFEERAAETLDIRADHLIAQPIGIDDGAAFECGDQAHYAYAVCAIVDGDLGARRYVTSLLVSSSDAEAASCCFCARPAETLCRRFEDGTKARVFEILKAKFQRIDFGGLREGVHVGFAGEMIGSGGESAVGAAAQN